MKLPKLKFVERKIRHLLAEGRNYSVGFTLCYKKDSQVVATQAISPCRDYLNDEVFTNQTKRPYTAYGQHSEYKDIFRDGNGYLVFGVCKRGAKNPVEYGDYKRDYDALAKNYKSLQKFLNFFDKKFKVKKKTQVIKLEENRYLAIFDLFYGNATYKISLLSFLIRAGIYYESGDPLDYLDNFDKNSEDKYLYNSFKHKLLAMMKGIHPVQNFDTIGDVHSCGIVTFEFPKAADLYQKKEMIVKLPKKPTDILQPMKF